MTTTTQIILHQNADDTDRYDVYDLAADTFTSFDDLVFVETVDQLPEGAERVNEDEHINADYDATYELRS